MLSHFLYSIHSMFCHHGSAAPDSSHCLVPVILHSPSVCSCYSTLFFYFISFCSSVLLILCCSSVSFSFFFFFPFTLLFSLLLLTLSPWCLFFHSLFYSWSHSLCCCTKVVHAVLTVHLCKSVDYTNNLKTETIIF